MRFAKKNTLYYTNGCITIMAWELIFGLAVFAFVSSITPGPNNIMLLASGVNYGFIRTLPHSLGVSLGFGFMFLFIGFGLGALLQAYPWLLTYLKVIALIYMLYLSWRIAFSKAIDSENVKVSKPMTFIEACLFQWINPKAVIMAATAATLYVDSENTIQSVLLVALIFSLINFPSVNMWTLFGTMLRNFLSDPRRLRIFNFMMGGLLILSIVPIVFS